MAEWSANDDREPVSHMLVDKPHPMNGTLAADSVQCCVTSPPYSNGRMVQGLTALIDGIKSSDVFIGIALATSGVYPSRPVMKRSGTCDLGAMLHAYLLQCSQFDNCLCVRAFDPKVRKDSPKDISSRFVSCLVREQTSFRQSASGTFFLEVPAANGFGDKPNRALIDHLDTNASVIAGVNSASQVSVGLSPLDSNVTLTVDQTSNVCEFKISSHVAPSSWVYVTTEGRC